jgi:tRNA threonylcarbamoyladenosine biosynthesis protein TsaB
MTVLGIETSGDTASVAIRQDDVIVASRSFPSRSTLCERLATEVGSALEHLGEGRRPDGIAVSRGPGSFTSLRIGVVTAKAFAHRFGVPLVGVATTEVVASPFTAETDRTIAVMLPAWNTAVYLAVYTMVPDRGLAEQQAPAALQPAEAAQQLARLTGPVWLVGRAALAHREALSEALGDRATFASAALCEPDAVCLTEVALSRIGEADPEAAFRLRPLYIVPSQAERTAGIDLGLTGEDRS